MILSASTRSYLVVIDPNVFLSPAAPEARDGRYCNAPRPSVRLSVCLSVRPSVTFSFRTVTQKRIAVLVYFLETLQVRAPSHGGVLYSF